VHAEREGDQRGWEDVEMTIKMMESITATEGSIMILHNSLNDRGNHETRLIRTINQGFRITIIDRHKKKKKRKTKKRRKRKRRRTRTTKKNNTNCLIMVNLVLLQSHEKYCQYLQRWNIPVYFHDERNGASNLIAIV